VISAGLGGSLSNFDQVAIHVFPNPRMAREIWLQQAQPIGAVDPAITALYSEGSPACGQLAIDIAGKSVSTSFVGAMAAAISVGELLRTFNRGTRFDEINFNARWMGDLTANVAARPLPTTAVGALGYASRF
jgi:hypothetical protein